MKNILSIFVFLILFPCIILAQDAKSIVKKADEKAKGNTSVALISIQTIRPNWTREMTVKAWTKGNDLTMILVLTPAKEKGVVFLKKKKEVWNWVPSIERNIKMPPSMMSQSWMGTDFTNDDLVKEASILEDYNHTFLEDIEIDGRNCYKIQLIPKPKSAVVWGKVILSIDKKDYMMLHAEYFDEDGKLMNTMHCSDVKMLGGKLLPAKMEMIPADKKGNKTILTYKSLIFDTPITDQFFSTQNITKVK
ncbi:outer membrane lipoprotein-sorting protein [Cloacibacterium sp. TD35]|uniref:outer membrane lipoprotein-sorting protein n=1 Tax=Cloacibacterium sp. TD35 TaxID=2976818 RepID=UPI00237DE8F0|nr:outer membrane lipoprotein-sorting protein [Cloacibacterium sp. TD35]WDT67442.1 outer membrane lipoprotein-sorting protein [Cloacibacterium sp. TD35]